MTSTHLQEIIERHHQITGAQVVFLDVEAYSKRRTQNQIAVVQAFTSALQSALTSISQEYVTYGQSNDVNFLRDIIRLPTGDGAAVIFTFDGLNDIHLRFALTMLAAADAQREAECARFDAEGWCNCHDYYNLRVGVNEGKAIVFKDVNDGFNVAGGVVNMAARIMGLVGRNQIGFTEAAYDHLVDLSNDPNLADKFQEYENVKIKHDLRVNVFQYRDEDALGLNSSVSEALAVEQEMRQVMERMKASGLAGAFPFPNDSSTPADALDVFKKLESMMQLMMNASAPTVPPRGTVEGGVPGVDNPP